MTQYVQAGMNHNERSSGFGLGYKRYVVQYIPEGGYMGVWDREELKFVGKTQTEAGARIMARRMNKQSGQKNV